MATFMSMLIKMSLRGIVIIFAVLLVRLLLEKLRISHKYILGLWAMTFLYFIVPWKLSLPVGFWNNVSLPEEIRVITAVQPIQDEPRGMSDGKTADASVSPAEGNGNAAAAVPAQATVSEQTPGQSAAGMSAVKKDNPERPEFGSSIGFLWLVGLSVLFGHTVYTYFALKRKLQVSILYRDNIWWAEDIDMPMVFGLFRPRIYLPVFMRSENLSYVVAHEKMHIKRKDAAFKLFVYVICLIHWFNPFAWLAYLLFANDMEKACDEEVIQSVGKEKRKEYAYALLHIAAGNGMRKKIMFVAPICFDEGDVKSRIGNVMQYKYTLPGAGMAVVIAILVLSAVFLTEAKEKGSAENEITGTEGEPAGENDGENIDAGTNPDEGTKALPAFYVEDLNTLQIRDGFSLEDYYITSRYTASNHYYIDENRVLWGTGKNEYGQLGTGTYGAEEYYGEPVRIAENVLSVDASWNDYFCIYLTEDGRLYGIGLMLLGDDSVSQVPPQHVFRIAAEPVLLMTDVAYARAGLESVVALQNNHAAYWWGQYAPTTHANVAAGFESYVKVQEETFDSVRMLSAEPLKIMENCRYVTTGMFSGAAISDAGELYTWGFNIFGQCGIPVTEDDFVRTPVKVTDGVKMVWQGRIAFSDPISRSPEFGIWETDYEYNTFILKEDNSLLAVGLNTGDKEKITQLNGDIVETRTHQYGDTFVPARAIEYSVNNNLAILGELEFGMSIEEVEEILSGAGRSTFRTADESVHGEGYALCLSAQYNQYHCYFDSENRLARISIQEGGSRDGRFAVEMPLPDLEKAVETAGGSLVKVESDTPWEVWLYQDQEQQIQYEFSVYEGSVTVVKETAMPE